MTSKFTDLFSEEVLNLVLDELRVGITVVDNNGKAVYFNAYAEHLLGWKKDSEENSIMSCHQPYTLHLVLNKLNSNKTKKEWHRVIQRKDRFIENIYLPINIVGMDRAILIITRDVTGREQAKKFLEKAAITDAQTGLYNRRYLNILHNELLEKKESFAAIMIDVNGLKFINDNFGHEAGDKIILEAARTINESVREADFIFRYGGDEFLVILFTDDPEVCRNITERIKANNKTPTPEKPLALNLSLGYCTSKEQTHENVITCADMRMYEDKEAFYNNEGKFIKELKKL